MSQQSMIERIARAIRGRAGPPYVNGMTEGDAMIAARAALETMREPSPAMFQAGSRDVFVENSSDAREIWQAMIDAALANPPAGTP